MSSTGTTEIRYIGAGTPTDEQMDQVRSEYIEAIATGREITLSEDWALIHHARIE